MIRLWIDQSGDLMLQLRARLASKDKEQWFQQTGRLSVFQINDEANMANFVRRQFELFGYSLGIQLSSGKINYLTKDEQGRPLINLDRLSSSWKIDDGEKKNE